MATKLPTSQMQSKKRTGRKAGYNSTDHFMSVGVGDDKPKLKKKLGRLIDSESRKEQADHRSTQLEK